MKPMSLLSPALAASLLLAVAASAGPGRGLPPDGGGRFAAALDLTDEQRTQIDAMRDGLREQLRTLRAQGATLRQQANALRQQHREQVQSILTAEQQQTLEQLRAQRPPRSGRRGQGPPRALLERLDLSDAQREQLTALRQQHRAQLDAARADGADRAAVRGLFEQHREQMRSLLTAEQQERLDAFRERIGDRRGRRGPHRPDQPGAARPGADGPGADSPGADDGSWGEWKRSLDRDTP